MKVSRVRGVVRILFLTEGERSAANVKIGGEMRPIHIR